MPPNKQSQYKDSNERRSDTYTLSSQHLYKETYQQSLSQTNRTTEVGGRPSQGTYLNSSSTYNTSSKPSASAQVSSASAHVSSASAHVSSHDSAYDIHSYKFSDGTQSRQPEGQGHSLSTNTLPEPAKVQYVSTNSRPESSHAHSLSVNHARPESGKMQPASTSGRPESSHAHSLGVNNARPESGKTQPVSTSGRPESSHAHSLSASGTSNHHHGGLDDKMIQRNLEMYQLIAESSNLLGPAPGGFTGRLSEDFLDIHVTYTHLHVTCILTYIHITHIRRSRATGI
jgi:hypothetical protein